MVKRNDTKTVCGRIDLWCCSATDYCVVCGSFCNLALCTMDRLSPGQESATLPGNLVRPMLPHRETCSSFTYKPPEANPVITHADAQNSNMCQR